MWPISVDGFRHALAAIPDRARPQRLVAEAGGGVVAWSPALFAFESARTDTGFAGVTVAPAVRRRGVGSRLLERALDHLRAGGATRASSEAWEDDGRRFLERRGFRQTFERRLSALDPRDVRRGEVERARAAAALEGYEVVPFSACEPEEVHAVDAVASRDIPGDDAMDDVRFDEWHARHWRHPLRSLEGSLAARHDGRVVAVTFLRVDGDRGRAMNDMTGTLPEHRGRRVATLLKLVQAEWLAEHGVASVVTENDETNRAMLAINERLGFRPIGSVFSYLHEQL
jgi:GNAT superfamily N-acetyltransferase